jgi:hypothetical protein
MIDLGNELQTAREEQEISLSEAETATRIKQRYLKALEMNDWAALPTAVQARGFLRNYATFLGLSEDEIMAKFSQVSRSSEISLPAAPAADTPVPTTGEDGVVFRPRDIAIERMGLPGWVSSDILIGIALAIVVALLGFAVLSLASGNPNEEGAAITGTPPGAADVATQAPGATADAIEPGEVTPTFDASAGQIALQLQATEHVWVRVRVDGAQVLEGILAPGAPQTWQGTEQIVLETANGAGLQVTVNGQPQGQLGQRGEAVILAWGPDGPITLTPTAQP